MPRGEGNPQLEDGFARIAVEILEAIARTPLSDYESRCIHHLWRQTYGWFEASGQAKKADRISYSQWSEATGITRRNVIRTLCMLEERYIVSKKESPEVAMIEWGFNKHWKEWVVDLDKLYQLRRRAHLGGQGVVSVGTPLINKSGSALVSLRTPPAPYGHQQPHHTDTSSPTIRTPTKDTIKDKIRLPLRTRARARETEKMISAIANLYEDNIGIITPVVSEELKDIVKTYPVGWFEEAVKEAVTNNARNLKYILAILKRWAVEGFKSERRVDRADQPGKRTRSTRPGRVPTDEELDEQARRYHIVNG